MPNRPSAILIISLLVAALGIMAIFAVNSHPPAVANPDPNSLDVVPMAASGGEPHTDVREAMLRPVPAPAAKAATVTAPLPAAGARSDSNTSTVPPAPSELSAASPRTSASQASPASAAPPSPAPTGPFIVFDGGQTAGGGGWSAPQDSTTLGKADGALVLKGSTTNWWLGAGWNWYNWYGLGDDLSSQTTLSVRMHLVSGDPKEITVHLMDANKQAGSKIGLVKQGMVTMAALRSGWQELSLPLDGLCRGLDRTAVWELDVGLSFANASGSATLLIDDIRFEK